jgi:hypothetical protein
MANTARSTSSQPQSQSQSQHALGSKSISHSHHTTAGSGTATTRKTIRHVPWTEHTLRQLKLVLPGAAITYYLGTLNNFYSILHGTGGSWARLVSRHWYISMIIQLKSSPHLFLLSIGVLPFEFLNEALLAWGLLDSDSSPSPYFSTSCSCHG